MNIIETEYLDLELDNNDGSKIFLMDQIIEHFLPTFSREIEEKKNQLNINKEDLDKLRRDVTTGRTQLKDLITQIKKESLMTEIITETKSLIAYDVLYGASKHTVKNILSTLNKQTEEDLTQSLSTVKKLVRENLKK